jgi:hypothetical protein
MLYWFLYLILVLDFLLLLGRVSSLAELLVLLESAKLTSQLFRQRAMT